MANRTNLRRLTSSRILGGSPRASRTPPPASIPYTTPGNAIVAPIQLCHHQVRLKITGLRLPLRRARPDRLRHSHRTGAPTDPSVVRILAKFFRAHIDLQPVLLFYTCSPDVVPC